QSCANSFAVHPLECRARAAATLPTPCPRTPCGGLLVPAESPSGPAEPDSPVQPTAAVTASVGPALDRPAPIAPAAPSPRAAAITAIGRYRTLQQIGEGGFGIVFMAEQREPVQRRVALKIIKHGMDTRQVIARFEAERQALALMDHPNIARVFDAGETSDGRPYFVMELVTGTRITEYCDRNQLSIDDRLDVFQQVCSAVQHAHTKGVIHRDLK